MSFAVSEITLSRELSSIIIDYQDLKINIKRQLSLCIFATMSVAISSKLSYVLLLTTLICEIGTLVLMIIRTRSQMVSNCV